MSSQRNQGGIVRIKELAMHVKHKVNLLGVVLEFSIPRKSQGTDYVCVLKIVDDSQQSPELLVNIFTSSIDQLPRVLSPRDLILLKNVMIKKHQAELSAVFYKDSSSFALFDGNSGSNLLPYQSSPQRFEITEAEERRINVLRQWCVGFEFSSGSNDYLLSLKDISEHRYFDLVCKVFHVSYDDSKGLWMLFVWDGTDVPPLSIPGKLEDEEHNPLPLHIESSPLDLETLRNFFPVGTVLRVSTDRSYENFGRYFTATGKWVRIRNMSCQVSSGMWHGLLQSSSKIRLFSDNDNVVWDYMRFRERISGGHGHMPIWTDPSSQFLTEVDWVNVASVTLMKIATQLQGNVRCCCIVRVVSIHPFQAEHYSSPNGSSEYTMKLTLEDPTARIHALLCGKEWVKFFGGSPPPDVLTKKIKMLLGMPEHEDGNDDMVRNPPWIKCFLHLKESDGGRNRVYYIRWTKLVTD
ncbi:hypothetical protein CISIN_1g012376mg [Citrus sinensis]|uniref:Protection of telomeres protein 1 n=1 Tax=Citrus sinensis TaxID=2711 RepID=A0A067FXX0_CITSI|nr:hypothetical protein CISIN_1g012376mg [Citrus sinensis]